MTDKKKSKSIEVEGLVVKIDVDASAISEATAALRELADAANAAREALDKLFGGSETVVNVEVPQHRPASAILDNMLPGCLGSGVRAGREEV